MSCSQGCVRCPNSRKTFRQRMSHATNSFFQVLTKGKEASCTSANIGNFSITSLIDMAKKSRSNKRIAAAASCVARVMRPLRVRLFHEI